MTPETRAILERWLESDDPIERKAARWRLSLPAEPTPAPTSPQLPPSSVSIRAVKLGFRQCFYASHEGCGCSGTKCFRHGRIVQLIDCIECLKGA